MKKSPWKQWAFKLPLLYLILVGVGLIYTFFFIPRSEPAWGIVPLLPIFVVLIPMDVFGNGDHPPSEFLFLFLFLAFLLWLLVLAGIGLQIDRSKKVQSGKWQKVLHFIQEKTPRWKSFSRGLAFFLGIFSFSNALASFFTPALGGNHWWIDLRPLNSSATNLILLGAALCLLAFALQPKLSAWRSKATIVFLVLLLCVSVYNTATFYLLLTSGQIQAGIPIPFSLLVSMSLGLLLCNLSQFQTEKNTAKLRDLVLSGSSFCFCLLAFPVLQMLFYGETDYRRHADAIVVFGARVYADGRPSDALSDRVRTACNLYHQGYATKLLFSGGPGDGSTHETEAMKRMAIFSGVSESDILLDASGLNTQATVENSRSFIKKNGIRRVLAVSHFYHLPRIKMCFERAGIEAFTVPAEEGFPLRKTPWFMAREVVAFWGYYLAALA